MANTSTGSNTTDVILVGGGIMSATLGAFLKVLQPDITINVFERLDAVAEESSDAWNNAGTGHSALCELNYTPQKADGSIDATKAYKINEQFQLSKQFWAHLVQSGFIKDPLEFIRRTPHMSFVIGEDNAVFLKKRFEKLSQHHLFRGMQYSENSEEVKEWIPLVIEGRDPSEKIAATRVEYGTDVNFGALTRLLFNHLQEEDGVNIFLNHDVTNIKRNNVGNWQISVKNTLTGSTEKYEAPFIFVGAGGRALPLIQKSGIPEGKGYGGFPVSGQWLRCLNEDVINKHFAKVYGKASVGAPPMSVPHLDTRVIDGKRQLLFGPYAGFSTKFLKHGSYMDLPASIKFSNMYPMIKAGLDNIPLTRYLIQQVRQNQEDRVKALQEYYPNAKSEDWELAIAGQRVQIIKKDASKGGVLQFGTEVLTSADGSISALLGASPGASTSVPIMLNLLEKCFKDKMDSGWRNRLAEMIPSYGKSLTDDEVLFNTLSEEYNKVLGIVE